MLLERVRRASMPRRALGSVVGVVAALFLHTAAALEPFVVRDIRIEGIQRTEPGTVFGYLPVKVGETMTDEKATGAIRALFATGFFKDVRLEVDRDVLVVVLEERPAVASIDITGSKEFDKDTLKRAMRDIGLAESRIFDRSLLERAEQEIKRQYLSRGKYAAQVTTTVTPLERNRVGVQIAIDEGESARITGIRIIGNQAYSESTLLDQFRLSTPTWLSWYTKNDQYSREKLQGDLETLRSYYLDRGYLEFAITSTQVSITPDKEDVFLTVGISEGQQYKVANIGFGGDLLGRESDFRALMTLKPGDVFAGNRLSESTKAISERLGTLGYAFANVNAVPELDRDKREVSFNVLVDPGRRVYVRRINVTGNSRTRDEVVRRELRQFEDSWYDADKIRLSRERVGRLGYFKDVQIESQPVLDAPDQVDLNVVVEERPTGTVLAAIGVSSTEKLILSGSINQQNFLGTGRSLLLEGSTSRLNRNIILSYGDPYFTADGISRTFDIFTRTFNASRLNLGNYQTRTSGVGLRFGIPYTEIDRLNVGLSAEQYSIKLFENPPVRWQQFVETFGDSSYALLGNIGWIRDSRDSAFAPTRGRVQSATMEATLPVGDFRYVRAIYNHQWYYPLNKDFTLALQGDVGIGRAFGGREYPLIKNFYAGGIGSVRGFAPSSLGPQETDVFVDSFGNTITRRAALGGNTRVLGSAEFIFALPGTGNDRSVRGFFFTDIGNVFGSGQSFSFNELRASAGIGLNWFSPVGPMKISFAFPLRREPQDRYQRIQFQIGTGF